MSNQYSIAFCPPPEIIDRVRQLKQFLRRRIGWYHSVNSLAHITVASFSANRWQLSAISRFAGSFCVRRTSTTVFFDHFSTYPNGAFFLAPDERSRNILAPVMKDFNQKMPLNAVHTAEPHITIARGLDGLNLNHARMLFANAIPDLSFRIDGLSLRRLNEVRGQYEIIDYFPFGNTGMQANDCAWQGYLWAENVPVH